MSFCCTLEKVTGIAWGAGAGGAFLAQPMASVSTRNAHTHRRVFRAKVVRPVVIRCISVSNPFPSRTSGYPYPKLRSSFALSSDLHRR